MSAKDEIDAALMEMPVAWLHMPALAAAAAALPQAKEGIPAPKIAPLAAAALGVAAGAGIQLASQALRKSPTMPKFDWGLTCTLTVKEIEVNATRVLEESQKAKDGGPLRAIADTAPTGSKALPLAAAAFLAGVAAGAAAARP